jgi:prolyl-tRNA synthetase
MKDGYSFDKDIKGLDKSYQIMYETYCRIFSRCGLRFVVCEAETGLMGGDISHEFFSPISERSKGEDQFVYCSRCGYAANREKAACVSEDPPGKGELKPPQLVHTPGYYTVEGVSKFLGSSPKDLLKTLIYRIDAELVALLIRGDHELNLSKLAKIFGTSQISPAEPETIEKLTGAPVGFSGPCGLEIKKYADLAVKNMQNFITGANKKDYHLLHVNYGRDFSIEKFEDLRMIKDRDICPRCKEEIKLSYGIELGHVFKLGKKYSESMGAIFQDKDGKSYPIQMGCYGIGVNRILAAAVELYGDERGIIWPRSIAPFEVIIISVNIKDKKIKEISAYIEDLLCKEGLSTLWDDRDVSAGIKFKDADLIGIPLRLVVGNKALSQRRIDIKRRNASAHQQKDANLEELPTAVKEELKIFEENLHS